jgi:hypothetical protein
MMASSDESTMAASLRTRFLRHLSLRDVQQHVDATNDVPALSRSGVG